MIGTTNTTNDDPGPNPPGATPAAATPPGGTPLPGVPAGATHPAAPTPPGGTPPGAAPAPLAHLAAATPPGGTPLGAGVTSSGSTPPGGTPAATPRAGTTPPGGTPAAGGPAAATGGAARPAPRVTATATGLWGRAEQQDFRSRVRGTLLGAAIGDALGAPLASLSLDAIREEHGPHGLAEPAPAHGRRGAVTAATQLTLFTVDGLVRAHVRRDTGAWHPPTDVHRAHRRWWATQNEWGPDERRTDNGWLAQQEWLYVRRDPDRDSLSGFADETLGTLDRPKNPTAQGAGAAARSTPFGLLVGWEPALVLQLSVECAAQSHGHPTAYLSAGAFAVIVHGLTRGDSLDSAVQRALGLLGARPGHQPVTDALQRALSAVTRGAPGPGSAEALSPGDGRSADEVLAIAVYCALVAEDIPKGLRLAVNHGGDSPATGALTGALLGAQHGETALPAAWLAGLEGRATVLELADDFALEMTQGPSLHGPAAVGQGWLARYPAHAN